MNNNLKIRQRILENVGIEWHGKQDADGRDAEPRDGYQHQDGLWFPFECGGNSLNKEEYHLSQGPFSTYIYDNIVLPHKIKSVLELGSGAGSLSYFLRKKHPELFVVTLDGNRQSYEKSPYIDREKHFVVRTDHNYEIVDESENIIKFDLVLSFEHFEHISPEKLPQFFENIKKHIHNDTLILASVASYGSPPLHLSVFTKNKWIEILNENGFSILNTEHLKYAPRPFNIQMNLTNELFFKLRENNEK